MKEDSIIKEKVAFPISRPYKEGDSYDKENERIITSDDGELLVVPWKVIVKKMEQRYQYEIGMLQSELAESRDKMKELDAALLQRNNEFKNLVAQNKAIRHDIKMSPDYRKKIVKIRKLKIEVFRLRSINKEFILRLISHGIDATVPIKYSVCKYNEDDED